MMFACLSLHLHSDIISVYASATPMDKSMYMSPSFQHSKGLQQSRCSINIHWVKEQMNPPRTAELCRQYYFPVQFLHRAEQSFLGWTYYVSEGCHSFSYHFWHSSVVWIYLCRNEVPKTDCVCCITISPAQYTWHSYCSSQGHEDNLYMDGNDTGCLCCHIILQMHI